MKKLILAGMFAAASMAAPMFTAPALAQLIPWNAKIFNCGGNQTACMYGRENAIRSGYRVSNISYCGYPSTACGLPQSGGYGYSFRYWR